MTEDLHRTLGFLEGRMAEQSAALQDLKAGQQQIKARIDRMFLATWAIGGGIIVALVGLLATQIIRGG